MENAVKIAQQCEARLAYRNNASSVNAMQSSYKKRMAKDYGGSMNEYNKPKQTFKEHFKKAKCDHCGFDNHMSNNCRFKNLRCNRCRKMGHIEGACMARKVNFMDNEEQLEIPHDMNCMLALMMFILLMI